MQTQGAEPKPRTRIVAYKVCCEACNLSQIYHGKDHTRCIHCLTLVLRQNQISTKIIGLPVDGASAIQCCYAVTERREVSTLTDIVESKNTNVTLRSAKKCIAGEKISLNDGRLVVNPACMAGVRTSRPNFNARWGLTKS